MKSTGVGRQAARPEASRRKPEATHNGKIHPVVIYPFRQPNDYSDLEQLYQLIARLDAEKKKYTRPITVIDRKTHYANEGNKGFLDFRKNVVARTQVPRVRKLPAPRPPNTCWLPEPPRAAVSPPLAVL